MKWIYRTIPAIVLLDIIPNIFTGTPHHWGAVITGDRLKVALLCFLVCSLIPYRKLMLKSLFFIWAISEVLLVINFVCNILGLLFQIPVLYTVSFVFLAWLILIWFREYDRDNDALDNLNFFRVSTIPKEPQDFFLSLFKEPIGGEGIYCQGKFYHYRKGKLQVHSLKYLVRTGDKYKIHRIRPVDSTRKAIIEGLKGSKYNNWSLLYNCKTVFAPTLSKRGKPLF